MLAGQVMSWLVFGVEHWERAAPGALSWSNWVVGIVFFTTGVYWVIGSDWILAGRRTWWPARINWNFDFEAAFPVWGRMLVWFLSVVMGSVIQWSIFGLPTAP